MPEINNEQAEPSTVSESPVSEDVPDSVIEPVIVIDSNKEESSSVDKPLHEDDIVKVEKRAQHAEAGNSLFVQIISI